MRSEKYNFCEYLGTPGLDYRLCAGEGYGPGWLKELLAHFRPTTTTPELSLTRPHPAGDIPGSRTMDLAAESAPSSEEPVKRNVFLESYDNFSQFMFSTSLVQLGPAKGVFNALAEVMDRQTIRIFRSWLAQRARETAKASDAELPITAPQQLWVDNDQTARLDIGVEELRWRGNAPILIGAEEDEAMTYSLEIRSEYSRESGSDEC